MHLNPDRTYNHVVSQNRKGLVLVSEWILTPVLNDGDILLPVLGVEPHKGYGVWMSCVRSMKNSWMTTVANELWDCAVLYAKRWEYYELHPHECLVSLCGYSGSSSSSARHLMTHHGPQAEAALLSVWLWWGVAVGGHTDLVPFLMCWLTRPWGGFECLSAPSYVRQ